MPEIDGDKTSAAQRSESTDMNIKSASIFAAAALALTSTATAAPKTYQVTGPVLEVTESMIAVQKGSERWEIARDASTKADGALKVGDKVTIKYSMTATQIEVKPDKTGGAETSSAATDSPKKK